MVITGDGFLGRCGRMGWQLGYIRAATEFTEEESVGKRSGSTVDANDPDSSGPAVRRWIGEDGRECALAADGTVLASGLDR